MNMLRKMQASFSWDWGPSVPTVGVWKPAYFELYNTAIIRDVTYNLIEDDSEWSIKITVYLELGKTAGAEAQGVLSASIMYGFTNSIAYASDIINIYVSFL